MTQPLHERLEANTRLRCKTDGCSNRRRRLSGYCASCGLNVNRWGAAHARALPPREWKKELDETRTFLTANREHEIVQAGETLLSEWLKDGPIARMSALEIRRLRLRGVTPIQIMENVTALWLFALRRHERLPDNDQLTLMLGHAVMSLAPLTSHERRKRDRHLSSDKKALGSYMRHHFTMLFAKLTGAVHHAAERRRKAWDTLYSESFSNE
jgi:hypothetical protein